MILGRIDCKIALVAIVLFAEGLLHVAAEIGDGCGDHGHVNGCSIPFGLPFFYKSQFTPACNKHDICYSCVSILMSK